MTAQPDTATVLNRLIAAAEAFVTGRDFAVTAEELEALRVNVRGAIDAAALTQLQAAAEGEEAAHFVGDLEDLLVQVLILLGTRVRYRRGGSDRKRRDKLLGLIGQLLPDVRADYHDALAARDLRRG